VVGRFVELVPHRRLVFTYGWEDGLMGVPPESTTVEIDLVERWAYFLNGLRAALSAS
jgi:uncharacterized protein YndB with AHSA1/START domain